LDKLVELSSRGSLEYYLVRHTDVVPHFIGQTWILLGNASKQQGIVLGSQYI